LDLFEKDFQEEVGSMPIQQQQSNKDPKLLQQDKFLVDVQEFL
jgi:hypothetical protein